MARGTQLRPRALPALRHRFRLPGIHGSRPAAALSCGLFICFGCGELDTQCRKLLLKDLPLALQTAEIRLKAGRGVREFLPKGAQRGPVGSQVVAQLGKVLQQGQPPAV